MVQGTFPRARAESQKWLCPLGALCISPASLQVLRCGIRAGGMRLCGGSLPPEIKKLLVSQQAWRHDQGAACPPLPIPSIVFNAQLSEQGCCREFKKVTFEQIKRQGEKCAGGPNKPLAPQQLHDPPWKLWHPHPCCRPCRSS